MATIIPYELKGMIRSDFQVDKASLKDFRALESNWREIFRWIVSVASSIPFYGADNDANTHLSDLWRNQVLTVLLELSQNSSELHDSTKALETQINDWKNRLEAYKAFGYSNSGSSRSMRVAEELVRKLTESLPPKNQESRFPRMPRRHIDDESRHYFAMIGALSDIRAKSDYYFSEIEASGDMDPSLALLLTFTKHYCEIIGKFNKKFEQLPDFYRREILNAVALGAIQDNADIIIIPNREATDKAFSLPAGTRFHAGEKLFYSLNEKSYVIPTVIRSAYTLFRNEKRIFTAPVAVDGSENLPLFDPDNQMNAPLEHGWAISSHILLLAEGERKVTVRFTLNGDENLETLYNCADTLFKLYVSGTEGWTEHMFTVLREPDTLALMFSIGNDEEALPLCTKDIHGFDSIYPAVRILFNEIPSLCECLASISFTDIHVTVNVSGIRTFSLSSNLGDIDSTQPFYPFGTSGSKGSWLMFSNEEMAMKDILSVSMKGIWEKLPDGGYSQLYANYQTSEPLTESSFKVKYECMERTDWLPCSDSPSMLFKTKPSGEISEDAEFRFDFSESPKRCRLFRIKLTEPSIGFGMDAYRQQFAETMMYNSKVKEKKQRPVPAMPQVPMLSEATLSYSAECHIGDSDTDDRLFRITETTGYEEVNVNNNTLFMPCMGLNYLYLELEKVSEANRLKLYFDIGDSGHDNSVCNELAIERYDSSSKAWIRIPAECMMAEETGGLTRSGYVEFSTIDATGSNVFTEDKGWIRIGLCNEALQRIIVNGIFLNHFRTVAENGDGSPLPAGTIVSTAEEDFRIAEIIQPKEGYGGKPIEDINSLSIRQTTRVSTRNRAIGASDYERLLLERFAEIERVCCVPASKQCDKVNVVVFPKPQKRTITSFPIWKLAEMESYLKEHISPFASICVRNADYDYLTINIKAVLKERVQDKDEVEQRLIRRIYKYFVPWFNNGEVPVLNKCYSKNEVESWLINDEGIQEFQMLDIEGGVPVYIRYDKEGQPVVIDDSRDAADIYYYGRTEWQIVFPQTFNIELIYNSSRIGESIIGENFRIG